MGAIRLTMEGPRKHATTRDVSRNSPTAAEPPSLPLPLTEDTIAAISTPPGEGGIGIVRLSGPKAINIVAAMFASSKGRDIQKDAGRVFHGEIRDGDASIDEVLVHVMRAPHTYTREDVVEINCHGGSAPLHAVLDTTLREGARLAEPGEFTKRAFLNGRIDLVQAEAVVDRIRAKSRAALRAAAGAAQGLLSKSIRELRDELRDAMARIEAAVDFPEDDLSELIDDNLRRALEDTHRRMLKLFNTADAGRLYREGTSAAIVGRTNVGKSSLFNSLLRENRAIVTAHPGTTRDLVEETINLAGVPLRLTDTAGLRSTQDEVERIGVEVARHALNTTALALFVIDASVPTTDEDETLAREVLDLDIPILLIVNKTDLEPNPHLPPWAAHFRATCRVSAKTGAGLDKLEAELATLLLGQGHVGFDQGMITRVHQKDSLRRSIEAVDRVLGGLSNGAPELLSIDLKDALSALGEITGETTPDDVLDRIFSSFCIGK